VQCRHLRSADLGSMLPEGSPPEISPEIPEIHAPGGFPRAHRQGAPPSRRVVPARLACWSVVAALAPPAKTVNGRYIWSACKQRSVTRGAQTDVPELQIPPPGTWPRPRSSLHYDYTVRVYTLEVMTPEVITSCV